MKRILTLLLAAIMSLSLFGCGNTTKEDAGASGTTSGGSAGSSVTGSAETPGDQANDAIRGDGSVTGDGSMTGDGSTVTGEGSTPVDGSTTKQSSVMRGATYGQMLRNAHVHDTDGYLRDGENAVTPGTKIY